MTKDTIHTALNAWATSRDIHIQVTEQTLPPPILDMRALLSPGEEDSAGAGLHVFIDVRAVFIDEEDPAPKSQISFWIPNSLRKGSWNFGGEWDEESPCWIPEFSSERELIAFIDRETAVFFVQVMMEFWLDEWLCDNGYTGRTTLSSPYASIGEPSHDGYFSRRSSELKFCGEAAAQEKELSLNDWHIVSFADAAGSVLTLGVSGWGDAATFHANEEGFLDFDQRGKGLRTRDALDAWLESVLNAKA